MRLDLFVPPAEQEELAESIRVVGESLRTLTQHAIDTSFAVDRGAAHRTGSALVQAKPALARLERFRALIEGEPPATRAVDAGAPQPLTSPIGACPRCGDPIGLLEAACWVAGEPRACHLRCGDERGNPLPQEPTPGA